jgi:hypothetical protein
MSDTNVEPTGTGQEGAGTPAGVKKDIPIHLEGQPIRKLDQVAGRAARRGLEREHREDATIFTN